MVLLVLVLARADGMGQEPRHASSEPPLVFVLPPVENITEMYEKFLPLKAYLERAIARSIVLTVARDYQDALEKIESGSGQLAYLDPAAYCEAAQRQRVIPLVRTIRNGSATYRSVLVVRSDSPITKIIEARGRRLALGNISSSSSYLIPVVMFKEVGIGLGDFSSVDYLEQEDRIALSVLAKRHDVGGLSERVARKYVRDGLKIINTSEPIPQYVVCASAKLAPALRERLRKALAAINRDRVPEIVEAMKDMDGFAAVEERDFDVVRVMIKNLTGRNYLRYGKNSVKVAILPLYSAITLFERFDPLMRYLSERTGYEFKLVIPRDFEDFYETIERGEAQFSYSNPYIYIQLADKGRLAAFANTVMEESGDNFRGIIITHRDSAVATIDDLKGRRVMAVSYKSAGGFLTQKLLLQDSGIDVHRDLRLTEGKRQEEVILNVYRRNVDAGFVRESALDVLKEEIDLTKIRIVARTPYIANWPFAATPAADRRLIEAVRQSLTGLRDERILSAAGVRSFKSAGDGNFDQLRKRIGRP